MQPGALRALEFDRIVEAVTAFALTPMGGQRLDQLQPSVDRAEVADLLAHTSEAARFVAAGGSFPLRSSTELPDTLAALGVEGRPLEALRLLALATFLESIDETRSVIRRTPGAFPRLEAIAGGAASFADETRATREKIEPSGYLVDHASPALRLIRERLRQQRARLRSTLESYLRGRETVKYLQEQVVTERNGRSVLVVKAEHRGSIPGIVHGSSTSGASLFLEPLGTVEINNDIVSLEEQEQEEIWRILLALTDSFRHRSEDMLRTVAAATSLDVVQARAAFSASIDGIEPALSSDGRLDLRAARHPLLKKPIPVAIAVNPPSTVLLITGPNTGGKTVALKTAGLLALMAQAGLHIPAGEGSSLPVFRSLFADIGDAQSIEASLSTFSAHITNLAAMDRSLVVPALVLLDEVGSGTDPMEGGALGVAVVDHFRKRGATLIATSHYDALKTYASTTEGVTSAAFGFDPDTFAPTYQILYGSPGRSLALEMAARLGLPRSIVASARENLSVREAQLAAHLAQLDRDMRALEHERALTTRTRDALDAAALRLRQREEAISQREALSRRRLGDELEAEVRKARREIDSVVAELKTKAAAIQREAGRHALTTGDTGTIRSDARGAVDQVVERMLTPAVPAAPVFEGRTPAVGDRVVVGTFGLEGVVTAVHGLVADVDVRGKRMRASLGELRVVGTAPAATGRVKVNVELQPRELAPADLNLVGCRVDEALDRAQRFLDESLLTDLHTVRVIHGYGSGQLKRALSGFLSQHPLVAHFTAAPPDQGGGGVTVVELKE